MWQTHLPSLYFVLILIFIWLLYLQIITGTLTYVKDTLHPLTDACHGESGCLHQEKLKNFAKLWRHELSRATLLGHPVRPYFHHRPPVNNIINVNTNLKTGIHCLLSCYKPTWTFKEWYVFRHTYASGFFSGALMEMWAPSIIPITFGIPLSSSTTADVSCLRWALVWNNIIKVNGLFFNPYGKFCSTSVCSGN